MLSLQAPVLTYHYQAHPHQLYCEAEKWYNENVKRMNHLYAFLTIGFLPESSTEPSSSLNKKAF